MRVWEDRESSKLWVTNSQVLTVVMPKSGGMKLPLFRGYMILREGGVDHAIVITAADPEQFLLLWSASCLADAGFAPISRRR